MRPFLVLFIFLTIMRINLYADDTLQIRIEQVPNGGTHMGLPIYPADQPDVYFDYDELEIIIDGPGSEASYYDVDIVSLSKLDTVLSTQVDGSYDTIDVSSLPDDNYQIVITSSNNNVYKGYFTNY